MQRYIEPFINQDLNKKMVFVGGPRQVGKTTLAHALLKAAKRGEYFNWDVSEDRSAIQKKLWLNDSKLVVFDELHKYPLWKQWIKGVYDSRPKLQQYMVTGSARLDTYKRGGDSLLGRYHYWRLHPLSIDELPPKMTPKEGLDRLLELGGFPEPFLLADIREARRWRRERFNRILREDIRDLEPIRDLQLLLLFVDALRERAGSLVVLSNLAEDLQISPKTAKNWLGLIERMYLAFPIFPLTQNIPRAIQKPPKVYFYDNADIKNQAGLRLENLVATTLIKRLHFVEDYYGYHCQLHYIRDKDGREVDFVTVIDGVVTDLIEVKLSDDNVSHALKYYAERLKPKNAVQLVCNLKRSFDSHGIRVTTPLEFFKTPPWQNTED